MGPAGQLLDDLTGSLDPDGFEVTAAPLAWRCRRCDTRVGVRDLSNRTRDPKIVETLTSLSVNHARSCPAGAAR